MVEFVRGIRATVPIGLVVGGAVKAEGEVSGRTTDVGSAERISDEIAKVLKPKFEEEGWL